MARKVACRFCSEQMETEARLSTAPRAYVTSSGPDSVEQPGWFESIRISRVPGPVKTDADMALNIQVVDLDWFDRPH